MSRAPRLLLALTAALATAAAAVLLAGSQPPRNEQRMREFYRAVGGPWPVARADFLPTRISEPPRE